MFVSKGFISAREASCVKCSLKANEGFLYPLAKAFVFINKPTMILKFEEVEAIEFKRYETTGVTNLMRNFDLSVVMKTGGVKGETKEYLFGAIDRAEYQPLMAFLASKKLTIKNPIVSCGTYKLMHTQMHIYAHTHTCTCTYTHMHIHPYIRALTHTLYAHTFYMHTHTYMHTHIICKYVFACFTFIFYPLILSPLHPLICRRQRKCLKEPREMYWAVQGRGTMTTATTMTRVTKVSHR